jgi:hypothetical protein
MIYDTCRNQAIPFARSAAFAFNRTEIYRGELDA